MKVIALDGLRIPGAIACNARRIRRVCSIIEAEARSGEPIILVGGALAYHVAARSRRLAGLVTTRLARRRWAFVEPHRFSACPVLLAPTAGDAELAQSRQLFDRLSVRKHMVVLARADSLAAAIAPFLAQCAS